MPRGRAPLERLTARQQETFQTARELGYFAIPREASIEDVADELGCAPGTASEHLRKAQQRVVGQLEFERLRQSSRSVWIDSPSNGASAVAR
ncbi:helix-turn-helix domain-containing protein [Natronobacterium gregoryi]|uniref:helix-turn-helix domain-containing protein n=1 Tax=Natronobacterium gregoryi TaxID=44930 RepID=UPI001E5F5F21|nr:helix-turn-helix domain-containing protein [Natronobacterium gregoryi]